MSLLDPAANVKKINITLTQSVDWEFEIEDGSNRIVGSMAYEDDFTGWLARTPTLRSEHPDIPILRLKKLKGTRQDGNRIKVALSYESNDPDAPIPDRGKIKRYHIEPGGGEEPMLTNKIFRDLTDTEKEAALQLVSSAKTPADFTTAAGVLTTEAGLKVIEKVRKGIEAYRGLGVVWVERFATKDLDDVELTKIFKTVANPPGGCPEAGSDYDWLRLLPQVSPHADGESWDIENRWELSLFGKWDEDFYPSGG